MVNFTQHQIATGDRADHNLPTHSPAIGHRSRSGNTAAARRLWVAGVLLIPVLAGCAAMHPVEGVPARYVPDELKADRRSGKRTIDLSLLRQSQPAHYLLDGGDVLAVYIEGILPRGNEVIPPVTVPTDGKSAPTLGYPIPVRDDGTLSLPLIDPIMVRGLTVGQAEDLIRRAYTIDQQILQAGRDRIMVSLQKARSYRVLVIRQEAGVNINSSASGAGQFNPGAVKRGSGQVVALPAYKNDVLHALAETGGLPGLDAENFIYVIRRPQHGGGPGCLPGTTEPAVPHGIRGPINPPGALPHPPGPENLQSRMHRRQQYNSPLRQIAATAADLHNSGAIRHASGSTTTGGSAPSAWGHSAPPQFPQPRPAVPTMNRQPQPSSDLAAQFAAPIRPESGLPNYRSQLFGNVNQTTSSEPQSLQAGLRPPIHPGDPAPSHLPAPGPIPAGPMAGGPGPQGMIHAPGDDPFLPLHVDHFPGHAFDSLSTVDRPDIVKIPVRLGPGDVPEFSEHDIILNDGDIVFIESRDTEIFYTGGLLGGGQYTLPRDYDLDVLGALSIAQSQGGAGGGGVDSPGGVSALNQDVTISASRVILLRKMPNGTQVPIEVDLYKAVRNPGERILIQPGDYILLQYTRWESFWAFIERHLLEGALFGVAGAQLNSN